MPSLTQAQYALLPAKMRGETEASRTIEREEDLHEMILADCRRRGWIALHGSMAHRSHRTIGEPDFVILTDQPATSVHLVFANRVLLIECKRPGQKQTYEQLALAAWAAKLGHTVHVVESFEQYARVTNSQSV